MSESDRAQAPGSPAPTPDARALDAPIPTADQALERTGPGAAATTPPKFDNVPASQPSVAAATQLPDDLAIPGLSQPPSDLALWRRRLALGTLVVSVVVTATVVGLNALKKPASADTHPGTAANQSTRVKFDATLLTAPTSSTASTTSPSSAGNAMDSAVVRTDPVRVPGIEVPGMELQGNAAPEAGGGSGAAAIALRAPGIGPMGVQPMGSPVAAMAAAAPTPVAGAAPQTRRPADDSPFVTGTSPAASPSGAANSPPVPPAAGTPGSTLGAYQSQLDGMVRQLQAMTDQVSGSGAGVAGLTLPPVTGGSGSTPVPAGSTPTLFGQLERSQTPAVKATMFGPRSLMIPKGVLFQCALKTRIVSAVSGFVGCQLQRHVYSDDGRVVLLERGSHLDGEYRIVQVRPGMTRIPVLWTRVRTPHGVSVDLDSPATGALGESGIGGDVQNRWPERIGAALLLSLIDDAIQVQSKDTSSTSSTVVLPNTTAAGSRLAEQVLASTINIPPLITTHPGSVVGVYVARDLDFTGVYRLEAR